MKPLLLVACSLMILSNNLSADPVTPLAQVLKWKDGKQAVFLLEFDDSAPTAIQKVIPELQRRGLPGTFYINPGNPPFKAHEAEWAKAAGSEFVILANHTITHIGATSVEQLDDQLSRCNAALKELTPGKPWPRLISFGRPGGVPWTLSPEEVQTRLAKFHLVDRPPFYGYPFQIKTQEALLAEVDKALAKGEMGHLDFHGVGGDWHVTPWETFLALLDKLDAHRAQLWITDPVTWHQYVTERDNAEITPLASGSDTIRLRLTSKTAPEFYNLPLTLSTRVPAAWQKCRITQGAKQTTLPATNSQVLYEALPGPDEITLQEAR